MKLTSDLIYGFTTTLLSKGFDQAVKTPDCHREWWDLCCSKHELVAIAAPRGHAKSTAVTLCYALAEICFRQSKFVMIVSDTYEQAVMFVQAIKKELEDNDDLRELFEITSFPKESEGDIIVQFSDGEKARIIAKGSGQKVRGLRWEGKRPDLIIGDDLENDEIVMNQERREKFKNWVLSALLPCRSKSGKVRIVGTILHMDSFLERLMPKEWDRDTIIEPVRIRSTRSQGGGWWSYKYRAHDDDYQNFLWPEQFPVAKLKQIRDIYVGQGNPEGYFQEYLNKPIDPSSAMFRSSDFTPMDKNDKDTVKNYYIACDFAVSLKNRRDYSVFVIGGVDENGILHIVNVIRERMDSMEIVDMLFRLVASYKPVMVTMEKGTIEKSIGPYIKAEMLSRGLFFHIETLTPSTDKVTRARSINARMRAGGVKFNKAGTWYAAFESELLTFPRDAHDDQVDAISWLGLTLDKHIEAPTVEELNEEEWEEEFGDSLDYDAGRSVVCGY